MRLSTVLFRIQDVNLAEFGWPCGDTFISNRSRCWTDPKTGKRLKTPIPYKVYQKIQESDSKAAKTLYKDREQKIRDKRKASVPGWKKSDVTKLTFKNGESIDLSPQDVKVLTGRKKLDRTDVMLLEDRPASVVLAKLISETNDPRLMKKWEGMLLSAGVLDGSIPREIIKDLDNFRAKNNKIEAPTPNKRSQQGKTQNWKAKANQTFNELFFAGKEITIDTTADGRTAKVKYIKNDSLGINYLEINEGNRLKKQPLTTREDLERYVQDLHNPKVIKAFGFDPNPRIERLPRTKKYTSADLSSMSIEQKKEIFNDVVEKIDNDIKNHPRFKDLEDTVNKKVASTYDGKEGRKTKDEISNYYSRPHSYLESVPMESKSAYASKVSDLQSEIRKDLGLSKKLVPGLAWDTNKLDWDKIFIDSQDNQKSKANKKTKKRSPKKVEASRHIVTAQFNRPTRTTHREKIKLLPKLVIAGRVWE
jgi:hypothetical protein